MPTLILILKIFATAYTVALYLGMLAQYSTEKTSLTMKFWTTAYHAMIVTFIWK